MCRGLAYLGQPISLDDLLFKSDSSLVKQSYLPKKMDRILNLAGFGMSLWKNPRERPLIYKINDLPFHDKNLKSLAEHFKAECLIAHVRGVPFSMGPIISQENAHPFLYEHCKIAFAHNGQLANYESMKADLYRQIKPEVMRHIVGSTDSELIYAIILSQLHDPYENPSIGDLTLAIIKTLWLINKIRKKHHESFPSAANLFISNGEYLVITRFEFDFGSRLKNTKSAQYAFHSLFYTYGEEYGLFEEEYKMSGKKKKAVLFSSEPLTSDTTTWIEVQEYSIMTAERKEDEIVIFTNDLEI